MRVLRIIAPFMAALMILAGIACDDNDGDDDNLLDGNNNTQDTIP